MSLCASGTPCSAPADLPFASAASAASAAASAASASIAMKALRRGCHCAIRSTQDLVTSRDETVFAAIAFATAVSDIKAGSVLIWQPLPPAPGGNLRARGRTAAYRQPAQNLQTPAPSNGQCVRQ